MRMLMLQRQSDVIRTAVRRLFVLCAAVFRFCSGGIPCKIVK